MIAVLHPLVWGVLLVNPIDSSQRLGPRLLGRLRQDSELLLSRSSHNWSQQDLQLQLSASSNSIADNNSSESTSSTETLKWLGSMSDVSEASHATSMSALSSAGRMGGEPLTCGYYGKRGFFETGDWH
ncbi:hypothetical protein quinque_011469 [Culex quinquefasciatus]